MALILGAHIGDEFLVGGRCLRVDGTEGKGTVILAREDGKKFRIHDDRATEVFPDVYVSIVSKSVYRLLRLSFDAPREVEILRQAVAAKD
jgi:sRNA-binding carbon storage regulator CsrA